jgi:hypothetical protein
MSVGNNHFANLIMDSYALAYIASRMKQMDIKNYSIEPYLVLLNNDKTQVDIQVINEFLFLVSKELPYGSEIISDSNYFQIWDYYSYMLVGGVQDFTGNVHIQIPPGSGQQLFEFIRVIPIIID